MTTKEREGIINKGIASRFTFPYGETPIEFLDHVMKYTYIDQDYPEDPYEIIAKWSSKSFKLIVATLLKESKTNPSAKELLISHLAHRSFLTKN